jgi:transglutaminase-like putative cysteine protease
MALGNSLYKVVVLLLLPVAVLSQSKVPGSATEASWIKPQAVDYSAAIPSKDVDDGYYYLISDNQHNLETNSSYSHYALKIVSDAGVQNSSQISVDYNPEYQKLQFHHIDIYRNGKKINQLFLQKIKTLQRETSLERYIYDGTYTAVLILDDVRKGDVIEYSYTITGRNPVYKGKYSNSFYLQYSAAIVNYYHKVLASPSRKFVIKEFNNASKPATGTENGLSTYVWSVKNPKIILPEDNAPRWYDPYAYVALTEYNDWKEVKVWAQSLFSKAGAVSPELKAEIEKIRQETTEEKKILAAIRFVQNDIRYMGIEIGIYSHQPNTPSKVFKQRFGDCKDKSFLLCTILAELGITAHPVLINTYAKEELDHWLPSPAAFNHCTAVIISGGRKYWVDPTSSYQGGALDYFAYPDYRRGLVVTDESEGLTEISRPSGGYIRATEHFKVLDLTGAAGAELTVTTIYEGSEADEMRFQLASNSLEELEESYKNFYARLYPNISKRDSLKINDNVQTNELSITENYLIPEFWQKDTVTNTGMIKATFEALLIESYLVNSKTRQRKMPVVLRFPTNIIENIEVELPEPWNITAESNSFQMDGITFKYNYSIAQNTIYLNYNFNITEDHIPVEKVENYFELLDVIYKNVTYQITYTPGGSISADAAATDQAFAVSGATNKTLVTFSFFYLFVVSYFFSRLYLINYKLQAGKALLPATGIGGVLIPFAIALCIFPVYLFFNLISSGYFDLDKMNSLCDLNEYWGFMIVFKVICILTLLAYSVFLLILFFRRRSSFIHFFVAFVIISFFLSIMEAVFSLKMLGYEHASFVHIFITMLVGACSIPFITLSERVKRTFINYHGNQNEYGESVSKVG